MSLNPFQNGTPGLGCSQATVTGLPYRGHCARMLTTAGTPPQDGVEIGSLIQEHLCDFAGLVVRKLPQERFSGQFYYASPALLVA